MQQRQEQHDATWKRKELAQKAKKVVIDHGWAGWAPQCASRAAQAVLRPPGDQRRQKGSVQHAHEGGHPS